ncbi:protein YqbG [Sporomusa sp.]|uniref:protein YqbG n=1 Tax=Sporomusa sp. TaxID=2078658 RepID=UPI002D11B764|nr:DUF3199 family protein [Sporomusa sp.]HWR07105.1 DUF3199 family protein [Sporomusa sp.]
MALIIPQQVIDYTDFEAVKARAPNKIESDILQAETELFSKAGHRFDTPAYIPLPATVELALIKLAEYYALINSDESIAKGYTSERLSDYSYTLSDGQTIRKPAIDLLIAEYIQKAAPKRPVSFKMRAL